MRKKRMLVVIALLLTVGVKGYMDKKEESKEAEKIETERRSVIALKKRFANIKSVEIKKSEFDKKTGAFDVTVRMTNQRNESVSFTFPFWYKEDEIGFILVVDKSVQVKGTTKNKVHVIYSDRDEGEV